MASFNSYSLATHDAQAVELQSAAENAYRHHGLAAPAKVHGEPLEDYRRRLLRPLQPHSKSWSDVNLYGLPEKAMQNIEREIFADSITAARSNTGPLREVKERDASGRTLSRFYGDPEACWAPFKQTPRLLVGFK